jgi:epsilon-lactone hydrolase
MHTETLSVVDAQSPSAMQSLDYEALHAAQGSANQRQGPRLVPARVLPVPNTVDEATKALVAAPYWPMLFDLDPPDDKAWRVAVKKSADEVEPKLVEARAILGITIEPTTVGGVKAYMLTPDSIPDSHRNQLVFHLHGGGFAFGTGKSGTGEAMLMAAYGGYKVLSLDYRMPPDFPFPAAVDDAAAAWRAVIADIDPRRIAVEGTSAGGGIALALMLRLKAEGLPLPGAIAPGSPACDLTETGDSYKTNEWVDNVLVSYAGYMSKFVALYANGHDLRDPQLSPIYGDFGGFPPAILTTGTRDLYLSNTVRAHRKLRQAGVIAELQVFEGLSHSQYTFEYFAPVTREAFGEIAIFFDTHLAA